MAGLSPLQQYTISGLLPGTLNAPQGFEGLLNLPGSIGPAAAGAMLAGEPTAGSQRALQTLSPRLYGPSGGVDSGYANIPTIQNTSNPYLTFLALSNLLASQQRPSPSVFPGAPATPTSSMVPGIGGPDIDVSKGALLAPGAVPQAPVPPPLPTPAQFSDPAVAAYLENLAKQALLRQAEEQRLRDFYGGNYGQPGYPGSGPNETGNWGA